MYVGGHYTPACKVPYLSTVIQQAYHQNICFQCGLSKGGQDLWRFHENNQGCDSGMNKTMANFCWYIYHHKKQLLNKYFEHSSVTPTEYVTWLGGKTHGFACNAYILFVDMIS